MYMASTILIPANSQMHTFSLYRIFFLNLDPFNHGISTPEWLKGFSTFASLNLTCANQHSPKSKPCSTILKNVIEPQSIQCPNLFSMSFSPSPFNLITSASHPLLFRNLLYFPSFISWSIEHKHNRSLIQVLSFTHLSPHAIRKSYLNTNTIMLFIY